MGLCFAESHFRSVQKHVCLFFCFLFLLKARCERRDFLQWAHLMVMFFCLVFLKKRLAT